MAAARATTWPGAGWCATSGWSRTTPSTGSTGPRARGCRAQRLLQELPPHGTDGLTRWCEDISARGSLAAGMVATNYAIEGVTGEWSQMIYDSAKYRESFDPSIRVAQPQVVAPSCRL